MATLEQSADIEEIVELEELFQIVESDNESHNVFARIERLRHITGDET